MEVRRVLRNDLANKDIFSEVWFVMSDKQRNAINNINDYLLVDDFYSELRKRNSYIRDSAIDESKLSELNKTCLLAAEKALKDIGWNKYS